MRSDPTSCNVLVSSAGRRVGLVQAFRTSLQGAGIGGKVFTSDMSQLSAAGLTADRHVLVPPCSDAGFVPTVLALCEELDVRLVIPTIDTELEALAAHRSEFIDRGTTVAISAEPVVRIGMDKILTNEWLVAAGLPTVQQVELEGSNPPFGYPFVVKPRFGSASVGVHIVRDRTDLDAALHREPELLAQELAHGREYTIDLLADQTGRCLCAVPRERLEVRGGEVTKAVTRQIAALIDLAHAACAALPGPFGALALQVFYDSDSGEIQVIELNPRFGGGYPLSLRAGADFPSWLIQHALGRPTTVGPFKWVPDLAMLRYDEGLYVAATDLGL